jgi:hypothetical protein
MAAYQILTLCIPLLSALIVGVLTYKFAIRSKKFDLLYASKIPAFKDIAVKLTNYKTFCRGRVAYYQGNEFSPNYVAGVGALSHRIEITTVTDLNSIFLSKSNRESIRTLLNNISILCNIELHIAEGKDVATDYSNVYEAAALQVEALIDILYQDLNL